MSTAAADGGHAFVGLDHVAGAGEDQRALLVRDDQQRLEPAQEPVRAPVLGQLHRGACQVLVEILQFSFEPLEEGERVRRRAGETREDRAVAEASDPGERLRRGRRGQEYARVHFDPMRNKARVADVIERGATSPVLPERR